jgi:hypothetical protein
MDAGIQSPGADNNPKPVTENQDKETLPKLNKEQLSFGAFGRLTRILTDIAENPVPAKEPQKANADE